MTDLVLYTRDNSQQKWIIHPTTHHVHLPPIEIMEPSVFVDVGKISNDVSQLPNTRTTVPNFGPTFNSFPCSQLPISTQETNTRIYEDMLLSENTSDIQSETLTTV